MVQVGDRSLSSQRLPAHIPCHGKRPRLRGWSHALAALGAIVVTLGLLSESRHDSVQWLSVLIFGLTMIDLYLISAIYHIGSWRGRRYTVLRTLDHANIFLVIAGTYTPICINVLAGTMQVVVLSLIWALALAGAACTMVMLRLPRIVSILMYAGMGLPSLVAVPSLTQLLPWEALAVFFAGGLLHALGAIVFALRRPNPLPAVFGFHEIFHLFVIAGNTAFMLMIWLWVLPFPYL
ncbi:MAG TPA: hemolysin III family protein [Herpetosiphonaceae bacterium]